jgi:seryl-tRNA synthetase
LLDINLIRENPEIVRKSLRDRQMDPAPVDNILTLDAQRRAAIAEVENLKAERNAVSKEISQIKDAAERQAKIAAMRAVGDKISELDERVAGIETDLTRFTAGLPNIPDARTPYGKDDSENVVTKTVG